MFDALKRLIAGQSAKAADPTSAELDPARLAAAALLVDAALADGIYASIESDMIEEVLRNTFRLEEAEAKTLLDAAETEAETAVDHHKFTRVAKTLPIGEREALVEGLWRVVFADGEESPLEAAFMRRVGALLAVEDRVSRLVRRKVADAAPAMPPDAETGADDPDQTGEDDASR